MSVTANYPQTDFLEMENKFRAFVAGYGSGKTWVGCMAKCIHFLEMPKINQGYFAPTYPHIRDIFYPTIDEVAHSFGMTVDIKTGDKEVHFYLGRQYRGTSICRSLERPESIVGFKIGHALVDELDVLKMEKAQTAWRKIIARMRYKVSDYPDLRNSIDITTTPEGFRQTHKMFVEDIVADPKKANNYGIIQASTYDNEKNLPDDYIPSLIEAYPEALIDAYINGRFVNLTTGTVYRNYNRERHNSNETIQEGENLFVGMDFNVGKMAAVVYVRRETGWHAVAELKDLFDTPDMIKVIQEKWQNEKSKHRIYIYPDASGGSRKTVDASKSDIALLEQAGFFVRVNPSNPRVKDRVMAVNKKFEKNELFVNARLCPTVAKSLEQQAYDGNGEPDKRSGHDHPNDAAGYPIVYEFPIVKPVIGMQFNFAK